MSIDTTIRIGKVELDINRHQVVEVAYKFIDDETIECIVITDGVMKKNERFVTSYKSLIVEETIDIFKFFCKKCGKRIWRDALNTHLVDLPLKILVETCICSDCLIKEGEENET